MNMHKVFFSAVFFTSVSGFIQAQSSEEPFIVMGKTDPVEIKEKSNPIPWGVGIGMLALFGIGGFMLSKRRT